MRTLYFAFLAIIMPMTAGFWGCETDEDIFEEMKNIQQDSSKTTTPADDTNDSVTPQPENSFEIIGIENLNETQSYYMDYSDTTLVFYQTGYYNFAGGFRITGNYVNNTSEDVNPTGTIWYGDSTSKEFNPMGMSATLAAETDDVFKLWNNQAHAYPGPGTYRIKVEITAPFLNGAITSTFEKDFTFDLKY